MKRKRKVVIFCLVFLLIVASFAIFKLPKTKTFTSNAMAKVFTDPIEVNYIKKIEISYYKNKARLSPYYTYNEVRGLYENNWSWPENAGYDRGNNNIYFYYCPSEEACEFRETTAGYGDKVKTDRYHFVKFEIYAANCEQGEESICENDFDKEHLDEIEVWVNGIKRDDAIVDDYNPYWHEVDVRFPIDVDTSSFVKSIKITSDTNHVEKGTTSNFTAVVAYYGDGYDSVSWSVIGASSNSTSINNSGVLSVGNDETSESIKVRATSTHDNTIYGEKNITIIDELLSIDSVEITNKVDKVVYGGSYQFKVLAKGTANLYVTWSISGANSAGSTIDEDGTLSVAADETATSVTVTATSKFDNTKKDSVTVNLGNKEIIKKIEISYNTDEVVFSSKTTYNDARSVLKRVWQLPENAGYDKGNDNIWFEYCNTKERCTSNFNNGYDTNMALDKYTYVDFEIFAKPSDSSYMPNQLYDFDSEHLDEIEIWVNGVKRDDAFINDYNSAWREVSVYIPVTVTDGKLTQYFDFYNNDPYYLNYGATPSKKSMNEYYRIGDGEITYASIDETIATVDEDGNVTPKKVGTCTITATASETEDYKEFSASYTLIVNPKYIYPSISEYENSQYYTGEPIHPDFIVTIDGGETSLVKDVDYTVEYGENTNIGSGQIYIYSVEGSNYTFSSPRGVNFYINRRTITAEDVTINNPKMTYTGDYLEAGVTIKVLGKTLVKDTDYTINYSSNLNIGTAYISIYGAGNYSGYVPLTFEIVEPPVYEKGDLNKNEKIDLGDIILSLKAYLNIEELSDEDKLLADIDEDGKLTLKDIISLLKTYLGIA